jgi:trans-2,3-dihydro-3-hydroxyanthranilate isomerase
MAERFFDMWRVDVFTDVPLEGNPLAVFPRATGLFKEEMEGITREMNLSETTFVFPATNPAAHYRNRIFTPGGEIPFAGHPSLGTAYVAASEGLVPKPEGVSVIYQELEIGVLPLELHVEGGQVQKVVMTQGEPSLGKRVTAMEGLAKALGVRARDVGAEKLKPQVASTGIPSFQVPMRSLDVVRGLDPDMKSLSRILAKFGAHTVCYAFALETVARDAQVHARSFSPLDGIPEDPATGSAAGACGAYLAANGSLPGPDFVIEQGFEMRHPSRIEVHVEAEGRVPKTIKVGGRVTPLLRGSLRLP